MPKMIQVELSRIIIDEKRQDQVIVLREKDGDRQIPIVIGFMEASSIKIKISGVDVPRPMTHDLLINAFVALGAVVTQVTIDELVNNTFHANIEVKAADGKIHLIDARPSDSVAIAVRARVPIFVAEEVLTKSALPQA